MPHGSAKQRWPARMIIATVLAPVLPLSSETRASSQTTSGASCQGDNGGITLPKGFCATIFADGIGHARQLVVAPGGAWPGLRA
jgi:hypothetical protein